MYHWPLYGYFHTFGLLVVLSIKMFLGMPENQGVLSLFLCSLYDITDSHMYTILNILFISLKRTLQKYVLKFCVEQHAIP